MNDELEAEVARARAAFARYRFATRIHLGRDHWYPTGGSWAIRKSREKFTRLLREFIAAGGAPDTLARAFGAPPPRDLSPWGAGLYERHTP